MKADIEKEFIEACTEHSDALFRYCFFKTKNREMSKDLVQETFMKTWNYLVKGKTIDNIHAFFYRIIHNLIVDEYRKKKSTSLDSLMENGFDLDVNYTETYIDKIDGEKALLLLDDIGDSYKDVIMMSYVQDLSLKEISIIIHESENAIAVKIHRGLKKVRTIFETKNKNKRN